MTLLERPCRSDCVKGPVRLATVHARQIHNTGEQTVPSQEGGRKRPGKPPQKPTLHPYIYTGEGSGFCFIWGRFGPVFAIWRGCEHRAGRQQLTGQAVVLRNRRAPTLQQHEIVLRVHRTPSFHEWKARPARNQRSAQTKARGIQGSHYSNPKTKSSGESRDRALTSLAARL